MMGHQPADHPITQIQRALDALKVERDALKLAFQVQARKANTLNLRVQVLEARDDALSDRARRYRDELIELGQENLRLQHELACAQAQLRRQHV